MIKRLIFDLDDTLIEWKDEYYEDFREVFNKLNIEYNETIKNNIIKAINTYEQTNEYYNREKMVEHINKSTNYKFDINFLNDILEISKKSIPNDNKNVYDILEYLSQRYELVILTNWFKDIQENRLKSFGILHFFSNIFASENFKVKPNKESFITAMENRLPEECIMIGDSLKIDIQGAINVGMKAIYINPNLDKEEKGEYTIINDIKELKNIL